MTLDEKIKEMTKALDAWYEGFNTGDIAHAYKYFTEDCTWSGVGANLERVTYTGRQTIIDYQAAWVHKVWTGKMKYFPQNTVCDGKVLMAEWKDEAISSQTGEKYTNQGIFVFEYDGGTLVKRGRAWFDSGPLAGKHVAKFAEQGVKTK
jgi:ketosteroid isomerase-like protein